MAQRLLRPLAVLTFACTAFGLVHAAELGEPRVSSYIGQQLVADVELTALEDAATPVQVRLASADVYRGASIAMPPVLSGLHLSVMRRDGRQFLHLTTLRPVDADHLHVYLELADGSQRTVRLATLWLAPDPNPAPPAPVAAPAPVAPPIAALPAPVVAGRAHLPSSVPSVPVRAPAPAKRVGRAAPLPTSSPKLAVAATRPVAHREAPPATPPAACPQQVAPAPASACLALDGKNAALRAEIGQLENKVRTLQASLTAAPAALPKPRPAARQLTAKPTAQVKRTARTAKPELPPKDHAWPSWTWIAAGGAVVAIGAAVFAWRRARSPKSTKKKKLNKPEMEVVVTPRVMGDVKSRLMTEQAEPSAE